MGRAQDSTEVSLPPARAFELWTDVSRWPTFIDDYAHAESVDDDWPAAGAKLVWVSRPHGRGRVTQKVNASDPGRRFATTVFEERLQGTQTASFEPIPSGGTRFRLDLEYQLTSAGVFAAITDFFFIRRALRDSLVRTCRRFASEAAQEASL
ncbi:MAG: SRPBCC family protein [Thermoleophilaceae bacterium]